MELEVKATSLRTRLDLDDHSDEDFHFPSTYLRPSGKRRSFCHWIIKDRILIGRYPYVDPVAAPPYSRGPSFEDADHHLRTLIGRGVTTFVCLQEEVPPQVRGDLWDSQGHAYLGKELRVDFPGPFVRYYDPAMRAWEAVAQTQGASVPRPDFIHFPITDLAVPWSDNAAYEFLGQLVDKMDMEDARIYVHCWGGRGRAGLVGACLLALLRPELSVKEVMRITQAGYDSRKGTRGARTGAVTAIDAFEQKHMVRARKQSPQTQEQRFWVEEFVEELAKI